MRELKYLKTDKAHPARSLSGFRSQRYPSKPLKLPVAVSDRRMRRKGRACTGKRSRVISRRALRFDDSRGKSTSQKSAHMGARDCHSPDPKRATHASSNASIFSMYSTRIKSVNPIRRPEHSLVES